MRHQPPHSFCIRLRLTHRLRLPTAAAPDGFFPLPLTPNDAKHAIESFLAPNHAPVHVSMQWTLGCTAFSPISPVHSHQPPHSFPPSPPMSASGLSYSPDSLKEFVRYIYAEYWADDLVHDRFVPTPCILAHFGPSVSWEYGSPVRSEGVPLIGCYEGHDGMSSFLENFGKTVKVNRWELVTLGLSDEEELLDDGVVATAFVELDADYTIRRTSRRLKLNEVHVIKLGKRGDGEPQILGVRILFHTNALLDALDEAVVE